MTESVSARLWRKYQISPEVGIKIFTHFSNGTPFSRIQAELGVDLATIGSMFQTRWQKDHISLGNELRSENENLKSDILQAETIRKKARISAINMDAIRSLLRLGIKPKDIQTYMQLDRGTFIAALNRINFPEEQGSGYDEENEAEIS